MGDFFNFTRPMGRAQYALILLLNIIAGAVGQFAHGSGVIGAVLFALCAFAMVCATIVAVFRRAADLDMHWRAPLIIIPVTVASEITLEMGRGGFLDSHLWFVAVLVVLRLFGVALGLTCLFWPGKLWRVRREETKAARDRANAVPA